MLPRNFSGSIIKNWASNLLTSDSRHSEAAASGCRSNLHHGNSEDHASAGSDPQEVLAHQEGCDTQTRSLVLSDDVISSCRRK